MLLLVAFVLSTAFSVSATCTAHTKRALPLEQQVFDYGAGGPLVWSRLAPEFAECAAGTRQAPTDVLSANTATVNDLVLAIPAVERTVFENLGTTVEVILDGTLTTGNTSTKLAQMHFHSPSEHHLDGVFFGAESHMVFEDEAGTISVLSVLYDLAAEGETPAISQILAQVDTIAEAGTETEIEGLEFAGFITDVVEGADFFTLQQSLTTPRVNWFIRTQPIPLSVANFNALKSVVKFNARPTQNTLGATNFLDQAVAAAPIDFQRAAAAFDAGEVLVAEGADPTAETETLAVAEEGTQELAASASSPTENSDPDFVPAFTVPVKRGVGRGQLKKRMF